MCDCELIKQFPAEVEETYGWNEENHESEVEIGEDGVMFYHEDDGEDDYSE